jgi:hypothetical protein
MTKKPRKKKVSEMSNEEVRALWKEEERKKAWESRQNEPLKHDTGNSYVDEREFIAKKEEKEIKDAWRKLIAEAKVRFPETLADRFSINPTRKIAALAELWRWPKAKIAKAAGVNERTVYKWLNEPEVKQFQEAVEYYTGTKDGKDMMDREVYQSIQVLKDMRDDGETADSVRKDIAFWFIEHKYGKPKERREHSGFNLGDLTKEIRALKDSEKDKFLEEVELEEILDDDDARKH